MDDDDAVTADAFRAALHGRFEAARKAGQAHADIGAGDLHREVGGYPAPHGWHRLPLCGRIMRSAMGPADEILSDPSTGQGASLVVRYRLPR